MATAAQATVYLIPTVLSEDGVNVLPQYILPTIMQCQILLVENLRTTRRYLKKLNKEIVIDQFVWLSMDEANAKEQFKQHIQNASTIGIISEAGCPGVADPGQEYVYIAQQQNAVLKPLVGPNSILLALMASGLNGQHFSFNGYLPINQHERNTAIKNLELLSQKNNSTQIFIETPYRNNQMLQSLLQVCKADTLLCVAVNLTGQDEWIKTQRIADWKKLALEIEKQPAIFLINVV